MQVHAKPIGVNLLMRRWQSVLRTVAALVLLIASITYNLQKAPAIDWDEGWTLTVAKNWVERGFYGRLLNGELAPPGLEASFPVVSTVALAFRILGVGVWQGRVAAVVTMLGALALLFVLTRRLFDARVAWVTLGVLFFLLPHPRTNAFLMARQIFAEPLMLLTITGGFLCLLWSRTQARGWIVGAIFFWGTALVSKAQVMPFLIAALLTGVGVNVLNRRRREAGEFAISLFGALVVWQVWLNLPQYILAGHTLPPAVLPEVVAVMAFVPSPSVRFTAVVLTLLTGLPIVCGLVYFACKQLANRTLIRLSDANDDVRKAMYVLASTWLLWYVLLSNAGIARYLFSPLFLGAPFGAVWFGDLTNQFDLRTTLNHLVALFHRRMLNRATRSAWLAFLLVIILLPLTLYFIITTIPSAEARATFETAEFLNQATPPNSKIETYDSELLMLLERPYHFPPDALHLALNRRMQQLPATVEYDPLTPDPDYLVIGPTSRVWQLYDSVVASGAFVPLQSFGAYTVYQRVR